MKRKAVLIEAWNARGQNEIPGAKIDIENWKSFLQSERGGGWYQSEISIFNKPASAQVTEALTVDADTYLFVAFSGHGCNGSVVLNDWVQDFSLDKLRPRSSRGTLIVDACRGPSEARRYAYTTFAAANAKMANAMNESTILRESSAGRATEFRSAVILGRGVTVTPAIPTERFYWDILTGGCPSGVVEMLACAYGQAAGENPKSGGYYTSLLLESADVWLRARTGTGWHSTKEAHDYAYKNLPPQQTPEYKPSDLSFPFAVKFENEAAKYPGRP
jgi:hypothetical protein